MFVRLRRGDSTQTFPVWVHGEKLGDIVRGAGIAVPQGGIAAHHHFLLPSDGTAYTFLPGTYTLEVLAVVVGKRSPEVLAKLELSISEEQARRLREDATFGLYFDWGPDTRRYHGHIKDARLKANVDVDPLAMFAEILGPPPRAPRGAPSLTSGRAAPDAAIDSEKAK
jgi:hypothetical protein